MPPKNNNEIPVGWPWRFLSFALVVFAAALAVYLGLKLGYRPYLEKTLAATEDKLEQLSESLSTDEQENFIRFYSQLVNLQGLLQNQTLTSLIFPFLERNTNQRVYYTILDFRAAERRLTLEGFAQSYEILSQELQAFDRAPEVARLFVGDTEQTPAGVRFRAHLNLKR